MTMLDRMRRHMGWLKWSLALVVLAFIIFYIPDFLRGTPTDLATTDAVAVVEGQQIRADEFQRTYQSQLQAYRAAYGGNMSEQLLKQLGVEQQILQQMMDERASVAEAERLHIQAGDEEVRQRILTLPAFQENGAFIGEQRYRQLLLSQNPPLTPAAFEDSVRRALVVEKLRLSLTEWLSVSDAELEHEYRRRNDKVKLSVVNLSADAFRSQVSASDADLAAHFQAHQDDFKIPEKRKMRYVLVDIDAIRAKLTIPAADIERAYGESIDQFSTPEQVRASHILLKTEGKDDAAVKAAAEEILTQAKAGADFAALARTRSEDEGTAKNGGDLDYFTRGRMVPEFDQVAFALQQPGQISDVVKTSFGYHVIKLVDRKAGSTRSLPEVRQQLTDQLSAERAQNDATDMADRLATLITKPTDLDAVAKAQGLLVQESGFFAREEPILGLGTSPEASARAFELKDGEVSEPLRTPRGYAFETLSGKQDAYIPKLEEVRERVREELIKTRARDAARRRAAEIAVTLKDTRDFEKATKAAGVEATATELLTRESPIPNIGQASELLDAAFTLTEGAVSGALPTENGAAIVKLLEKQEATAKDLETNRDRFRDELLNERRSRFFGAYMTKAKQKMKIEINREALKRVIG